MSDVVLPLHIGILFFTIVSILWADIYGSLWLHGKKQVLNNTLVQRLHTAVGIGLAGMIITGLTLFWPVREYLIAESTIFFLKMFFVFTLVLNSLVIDRYMAIATVQTFKDIPRRQKTILLISGALSSLCWLGAIICGLLLF